MFERFKSVNVIIKDFEFLKQIPIQNVEKFLEKSGWKVIQTFGQGENATAFLWSKGEEFSDILLPAKQHFLDYAARLSEALYTLSFAENKNQLVLVEEIYNESDSKSTNENA